MADLGNRIAELFPNDFQNLVHSILLVVSKVNAEQIETDDILKELEDIVRSHKYLSDSAKIVMTTLVEKKSVVLFPTPKYMNAEIVN